MGTRYQVGPQASRPPLQPRHPLLCGSPPSPPCPLPASFPLRAVGTPSRPSGRVRTGEQGPAKASSPALPLTLTLTHGRMLCPWCPHPTTASLSGSWASGLDTDPSPPGRRFCPGGSGRGRGGLEAGPVPASTGVRQELQKPLKTTRPGVKLGTPGLTDRGLRAGRASQQADPLSCCGPGEGRALSVPQALPPPSGRPSA